MRFQHPFTSLICGPTQSGKTYFVQKILENNQEVIFPIPTKIIWCYGEWQPAYEQMQKSIVPEIQFLEGLPSDIYERMNYRDNNLLIIDDLMNEISNDPKLAKLFTKGSHHHNLSIIYLVQNLFNKGRESRTASLNAHYIILFKSPRDTTQINCFGRQMYATKSKGFEFAYQDATKEPHGYLIVDMKQSTPEELRLRTGILPGQQPYVYVPDKL